MSEIIKLYRNAGIEKEVIKGCYEYYAENDGIDIYTVNDCKNKDCNTCKADKSIKEYPPFTAEKQIELIKWLAQKDYYTCDYCEIEPRKNGQEWLSYCHFKSWTSNTFENALAGLINEMWQSLTEEEKQQVKGILE